jgi:hypothetical protein
MGNLETPSMLAGEFVKRMQEDHRIHAAGNCDEGTLSAAQ